MGTISKSKMNTEKSSRVVIITAFWIKSEGGGIKTYIENLVSGIKDKCESIDIIFMKGDDSSNYQINSNNLVFILKSFMILMRLKPDIVHSQEAISCLIPGSLYKFLFKRKLIHTFHTDRRNDTLVKKILFKILLKYCNYVTFVSEALRTRLISLYNLDLTNDMVVYPGVSIAKTKEDDIYNFRDRFSLGDRSPILLANGLTAFYGKAEGAKILISTIKKLKSIYPNIVLILTRKGFYIESLMEFANKEGVSNSVIFAGDVGNISVPLQICDLYTHIVLVDAMPLAILEAMMARKPIIATSVGGIPEAITNDLTGLLVEPDVDDIASKIQYLLENRDIAGKLGENAKNVADRRFSIPRLSSKMRSLYFE